jgi:hypothetical protein
MVLACACDREIELAAYPSAAPGAPVSSTASPSSTPGPLQPAALAARPEELLEHPEKYVGHVVDLTVVEPLRGPETEETRLTGEYGFYAVDVPEGHDVSLDLVPPGFQLADDARYKARFDHVMTPPLRVRGEVLRDPRMPTPTLVVRVASAVPVDLGAPVHIADVAALGEGGRFDRKSVEIEGEIRHGFEVSAIGAEIWVSSARYRPGAFPVPVSPTAHAGILFAKKGARYGHLGGYRYELVMPAAP